MTSFRVQRLNQLKLKELVDCCSKALRDDPAQKALIGGDLNLMDEYMGIMLQATLLEGLLYVVCVGPETEERIVSTGSFFANGKFLFDSEQQRALGFDKFFEKLSPETQFWWNHTCLLIRNFLPPRRLKPVGGNLATHPDYQKRGYASAIMDTVFEEVKLAHSFLGVVPGTELNVGIYASMGFKEIGSTRLPAPTGDFDIHVMTRGR